jgi:hypothetical protein
MKSQNIRKRELRELKELKELKSSLSSSVPLTVFFFTVANTKTKQHPAVTLPRPTKKSWLDASAKQTELDGYGHGGFGCREFGPLDCWPEPV